MKKQTFLFIAAFLLCAMQTSQAQGEWEWAHYWTGNDGSSSDYFNKIINTAFDEEGNLYVYGSMGWSAQFDGIGFQYTNNATVITHQDRSILLAKFDTLGNMLWYKVVKNSSSVSVPRWMEVKDNKVYISGQTELDYVDWLANNAWLYYLDTLILGRDVHEVPVENREPPFQTGRWTFFATLDYDGNLLDDHFVESFSRERFLQGNEYIRTELSLCSYAGTAPTPVHTDSEGNIYMYTPIIYRGVESDSLTIMVDGDSSKMYNLFLPGNVNPNNSTAYITNAMLYKFSPAGELIFSKQLVDHTDGIASSFNLTGDSINKYFNVYYNGMSFDEDDNMYLTGYVQLGNWVYGHGGELHDYPVHIWWDNTHYITINDISSAHSCSFIIKYNTNGEVVWCNQLYSRGNPSESSSYAYGLWNNVTLKNNTLYIVGTGAYALGEEALIYFDNEENFLERFQSVKSDIGFFVSYNTVSGQYISHGIIPAAQAVMGKNSAVINNRLLAYANVNINNRILTQWRTDGLYIASDTIASPVSLVDGSLVVSEEGYLLMSCMAKSPIYFNDEVLVNCSTNHSSAVFALYHNPEFAQPFVADDSVDVDTYYQNREQDIYVYPNPTEGKTVVCGYMYDYRNIEIFDLQGRKVGESDWVELDLSAYPSGTYIIRVNFNRGVSVTRKVVKE